MIPPSGMTSRTALLPRHKGKRKALQSRGMGPWRGNLCRETASVTCLLSAVLFRSGSFSWVHCAVQSKGLDAHVPMGGIGTDTAGQVYCPCGQQDGCRRCQLPGLHWFRSTVEHRRTITSTTPHSRLGGHQSSAPQTAVFDTGAESEQPAPRLLGRNCRKTPSRNLR